MYGFFLECDYISLAKDSLLVWWNFPFPIASAFSKPMNDHNLRYQLILNWLWIPVNSLMSSAEKIPSLKDIFSSQRMIISSMFLILNYSHYYSWINTESWFWFSYTAMEQCEFLLDGSIPRHFCFLHYNRIALFRIDEVNKIYLHSLAATATTKYFLLIIY